MYANLGARSVISVAYAGYLIQVGNYKIPHNWIRAETYVVTKNGQDLDSYRDADGKLHRNALEHWVAKAEFETPPMKTNKEVATFMNSISSNYTDEVEKKANVTGIKNRKTNVIAEGKICPKCQCELVVKQSSYGTFYACGNYPNCKYTESSD